LGVHERTEEIAVLESAMGRAVGGPGAALLIEGPAGIGKTTVLDAARAAATTRGLPVLSARGTELERTHAFGGARRLLAPYLESLGERGFAGPAAAARAVLTDGAGAPTEPEPTAARLLGLVALLATLCEERGPLVVAVDDAHWLDDQTLDLLTMACTRLDSLPIVLVAAARTGEAELSPSLARLAADAEVRRLRLAPFGLDGVSAVLRERLGRPVDDELVEAALEATGGIPWFVAAMADELARNGATADGLRALAPEAIADTVEARVAAAAAEGRAVAQALVVLGDEAEPRHVSKLTGLRFERVVEVLEALARTGVLGSSSPPRFAHAIVRTAFERRMPPGRLALDHREAALMLTAEGAPPERAAAHLLRTEPAGETWSVEVLLEAARVARARGAPEHAARLLERALAEPPGPEARGQVLGRLGTAELEAGQGEASIGHLEQGLADGNVPRTETLRRLAQAYVGVGQAEDAVALLERTLDREELGRDDRVVLTADLAVLGVLAPGVARQTRERLRDLGEVDESTPGGRLALAVRARDLMWEGRDRDGTLDAARRALSKGKLAEESSVWIAWSYAVHALSVSDRQDLALAEIDGVLERAVSRAAVGWYCVARMLRADAHLRAGEPRTALADGVGSLEAARDHRLGTLPAVASTLALAQLAADEPHEADRTLSDHGLGGPLPEHVLFFTALYTRGCVRLALGEPAAALEDLLEFGAREERWAAPNACAYPWRRVAVSALRQLDRLDEARSLAAEQAELGERWGTPRAHALGRLALGLVAPDREGSRELFAEAAELAAAEAPLLRVEALIELGRSLRQSGERAAAREPLREAFAEAESRGALRLTRMAQAELRAARGRPPKRTRADDELTPSERRIAELAAAGASNREIAAQLFLSVRTVETHLTSAYRRLGVASRRQLPGALASASVERPDGQAGE
jgi:DNA-binding CsgD family transcriptional regulator